LSDPAAFAIMASDRRWLPYPHLLVIAEKLQQIQHGTCKRLIVMMPPRHGKSQFISQFFPPWYLIRNPHNRVILASYEADFAANWGRKSREVMERFGPGFGVKIRAESSAAQRWEIAKHDGGMMTAGVRGPITGKGMDLGIIDDPVKNDEEAASETYREKVWDWYLSTFSTRLHKGGAIICIMTRWHEDDLVGRLLKAQESGGDKWDIINLPALAEKAESNPLFRRKRGDALCPDLIPLKMLESARKRMGDYWWGSLYQQRPFPKGGGYFKRSAVEIIDAPMPNSVRVRAWDLAASKDGKRTAGVKLARSIDGEFVVEDVVMGKWEPAERDRMISQTAQMDGREVPVRLEQEGGSGGIAQIHAIVRRLAGFNVEGIRVTGSKEIRADAVASQCNVGNLKIVRGNWNDSFLSELEAFPTGAYLDQVDALSLGFGFISTKGMGAGIYSPLPKHVTEREVDKEFERYGSKKINRRDDWRDSMPI
jgi:predicted phage terminase large subunit-like protein